MKELDKIEIWCDSDHRTFGTTTRSDLNGDSNPKRPRNKPINVCHVINAV